MRRLCLVEDDPIMSESLLDRFAMEGFNTDWFENKATAIEAIRTRSYDMVLSDVQLPDGSGEDLLFELRDSPEKPAFVFITAHATVDRAVEMIKAGALNYITKPFDINALISRIKTIGPGQCVAQGDQIDLKGSELGLSSNAKASLLAYQWSGNVRELQNKFEKACVLSTNHLLLPSDFFETKTGGPVRHQPASPPSPHEFVREAEHHYLEETLYRCNGKAGDAAKALGISQKTLWEKCKRYGIRHQSPSSDNSTSKVGPFTCQIRN